MPPTVTARRSLLRLAFGCLAISCASAPKSPPIIRPAAESRPALPPTPELPERAWGKVSVPRFAAELRLPHAASWQISDTKGWFVAEHAETSSALALFAWSAPRNFGPRECEAEARVRRPSLPVVDDANIVDQKRLMLPADYDSQLIVIAMPGSAPSSIEGHALLFGASTGRCLAAIFSTQAVGDGQQTEVARRLKIATDGIFSSLRMLNVEERLMAPGTH